MHSVEISLLVAPAFPGQDREEGQLVEPQQDAATTRVHRQLGIGNAAMI